MMAPTFLRWPLLAAGLLAMASSSAGDSQSGTKDKSAAAPDRAALIHELEFYVGKTMALASAGKPYQEVIAHIGKPPPNHQEGLDEGDRVASLYPPSRLFSEMTFRLGSGEQASQVVAMDFIAKPGSFTMDDMQAVFGPWHRTPEQDEGTLFVLAWFPRYDKSSGAHMFLYADDAGRDNVVIAPGRTPGRVFFTTSYERED